jgi:hypothetical protein
MDPYLLPEAAAAVSAKAAITTTSIFSLPEEVNLKIIALLDPFDVWSLARTCKFFAKLTDNDLLWRHQWAKLSAKTPFRFPPSQNLQVRGKLSINYCMYYCFVGRSIREFLRALDSSVMSRLAYIYCV